MDLKKIGKFINTALVVCDIVTGVVLALRKIDQVIDKGEKESWKQQESKLQERVLWKHSAFSLSLLEGGDIIIWDVVYKITLISILAAHFVYDIYIEEKKNKKPKIWTND